MTRNEIKRMARYRVGGVLMSALNGWEPEDLIQEHGQDVVDQITDEAQILAQRMIDGDRA